MDPKVDLIPRSMQLGVTMWPCRHCCLCLKHPPLPLLHESSPQQDTNRCMCLCPLQPSRNKCMCLCPHTTFQNLSVACQPLDWSTSSEEELYHRAGRAEFANRKDLVYPSIKFAFYPKSRRQAFMEFWKEYDLVYISPALS